MAKTIKFNLICNNNPVRTIEDLQNNFSIEDILKYYENKLLHRWLEVRGYTNELEKVNAIRVGESLEIIKELIKIFNVESDEKKIEERVYIFEYLNEQKLLNSIYKEENYKIKSILEDYQTEYRQLISDILDYPNDIAKIKANIKKITTDYKWILELSHRELFFLLKEESPLAIMCLLMNQDSRKYYLPCKEEVILSPWEILLGATKDNIDTDPDKKEMFNEICSMIRTENFKENLKENLLSFSGITDGYWKDIESKGKKYMIISMEHGDFVRPAGISGGDLSSDDVTYKFVIIDGIDYKSNYSSHEILYMEV